MRESNSFLNIQAIILKIDRASRSIVIEEVMEDVSVEELREELPGHQPRFALYTFKLDHNDNGRVSYPMCLIYSTPRDCQTELQVLRPQDNIIESYVQY